MRTLLLAACVLVALPAWSEDGEKPSVPSLTITRPAGEPMTSPVEGTVAEIGPDELGSTRVVISVPLHYYFAGQAVETAYDLILVGLKDVQVKSGQILKRGDPLATIAVPGYVSARSTSVDPYLLRMTSQPPSKAPDGWRYTPSWLLPGAREWLSFRPVESLGAAVTDFYQRWAREDAEESLSENAGRLMTIHYFPDLDRIRVRVRLDDYPLATRGTVALGMTARTYFSATTQFVFETVLPELRVGGYTPVLYWQKGFDQYLRDEYTLGNEVYLYLGIFALDHQTKTITACVIDFALKSDEEVVDERRRPLEAP